MRAAFPYEQQLLPPLFVTPRPTAEALATLMDDDARARRIAFHDAHEARARAYRAPIVPAVRTQTAKNKAKDITGTGPLAPPDHPVVVPVNRLPGSFQHGAYVLPDRAFTERAATSGMEVAVVAAPEAGTLGKWDTKSVPHARMYCKGDYSLAVRQYPCHLQDATREECERFVVTCQTPEQKSALFSERFAAFGLAPFLLNDVLVSHTPAFGLVPFDMVVDLRPHAECMQIAENGDRPDVVAARATHYPHGVHAVKPVHLEPRWTEYFVAKGIPFEPRLLKARDEGGWEASTLLGTTTLQEWKLAAFGKWSADRKPTVVSDAWPKSLTLDANPGWIPLDLYEGKLAKIFGSSASRAKAGRTVAAADAGAAASAAAAAAAGPSGEFKLYAVPTYAVPDAVLPAFEPMPAFKDALGPLAPTRLAMRSAAEGTAWLTRELCRLYSEARPEAQRDPDLVELAAAVRAGSTDEDTFKGLFGEAEMWLKPRAAGDDAPAPAAPAAAAATAAAGGGEEKATEGVKPAYRVPWFVTFAVPTDLALYYERLHAGAGASA
jgi:hypothetical protein